LEAYSWLSKASHHGNTRGQKALGKLFLTGAKGLMPEPASAVFYFRSAVRSEDPEAAFLLAECYQRGLGAAKDARRVQFPPS